MKMIVGLGNPGGEYVNTRHNIGFMILDHYLKQDAWKKKFDGLYQIISINDEKVLFLKPHTFMNLSGNSVCKAKEFYHISIDDILVIQDDMDLAFGVHKLKKNSSSGGHNGIKSIIQCLKTNSFSRLKIGISHNLNSIQHVLGKFSNDELDFLEKQYTLYSAIIDSFVLNGIDKTMNQYNH